jgi:hypothetical protein
MYVYIYKWIYIYIYTNNLFIYIDTYICLYELNLVVVILPTVNPNARKYSNLVDFCFQSQNMRKSMFLVLILWTFCAVARK